MKFIINSVFALVLTSAFILSCGDDSSDDSTTTPPAEEEEEDNELDANSDMSSATKANIASFIEEGTYKSWAKTALTESSIHKAKMITYWGPILEASMQAGNARHTVGSASVKEMYDESDTLIGYAVMVKTNSDNNINSWTWYEIIESKGVDIYGAGDTRCTNCHSSGTDYVRGSL